MKVADQYLAQTRNAHEQKPEQRLGGIHKGRPAGGGSSLNGDACANFNL